MMLPLSSTQSGRQAMELVLSGGDKPRCVDLFAVCYLGGVLGEVVLRWAWAESGEVLSKTTGVLEAPGGASYNNKNGLEEDDWHA